MPKPAMFKRFPQGDRFRVRENGKGYEVFSLTVPNIAICPTQAYAEMVCDALEAKGRAEALYQAIVLQEDLAHQDAVIQEDCMHQEVGS